MEKDGIPSPFLSLFHLNLCAATYGITDLRSLSDVILCLLAGFTLEKLMLQ